MQYENAAKRILSRGKLKESRTGIDTIGIFGHQMRFDLSTGEFPLVTTKKVFTRGIFEELKWFIKGETNIKPLLEKDVHIWDSWATEDGNVGPIYGEIWRRFPTGVPVEFLADLLKNHQASPDGLKNALLDLVNDPKYQPIDQLSTLLVDLEKRPFSRRHLVTAWAPTVLPDESVSPQENVRNGRQSLAACHTFWQVYVEQMSYFEAVSYRNTYYNNVITALNFDLKEISTKIIKAEQGNQDILDSLYKERDVAYERLDKVLFEYRTFTTTVVLDPGYVGELLPRRRLSLQMYQRSADFPLGVPFNIASYAALLQIIAMKAGMMPGDFIHTIGDAHIYVNQVDLMKEQVSRDVRRSPVLFIDGVEKTTDWSDVGNYKFTVVGYDHHPAIKYPGAAV